MSFPQTLVKGVWFWCVGALLGIFLSICVCGVSFFVPKYHNYLGILGLIVIYRLRLQNYQPNSGTKSMYSMWITLPKPPVAEKVLQVLQTRGSTKHAWFIHNPEGLGEIHTMVSFHVHQLGTETDITSSFDPV